MMSEYANAYGHLPAPGASWALFISLTRKATRFWARRQLVNFDAVVDGVASLFGDGATAGQTIREELEGRAYPVSRKAGPSVIQNKWGTPAEESPDG